ncbi:PAAR domain-containing protein [Burkholderia multivorans]|uniref:PAAR domain-containing protein n=2 Tax=Burkholderia multivorans TaxID=87883 RepID=UPI0020169C2B|nr:PAAR domain-containing protein [Burkholderia multivorans]MCA8505513.1 PAAR domain-containing protein [Burkholderia multivorans]MCL4664547.1 PAAR domain-containing protein [Burkholderia multivorans]MCO1415875.1 PAAR domain-containing protein [Burkholderia multivorans]MCO1449818.1 PAAR domain-containing protein [Burkholderia multivorans]
MPVTESLIYEQELDMQDEQGRNMVRLGDTTDHGGKVVEATGEVKHLGIPVALDQHGVMCPKCAGVFPLLASGPRTHRGRRVGYVGDKTGCGATVIGS